jgi:hypothetical protein
MKSLIKSKKERIMSIPENRGKVKKISLSLINQMKSGISRPLKKFIMEMCFGMLTKGSSNINLIAGALNENKGLKHTLKRLHRMLLNGVLLEKANELSLKEALKKIGKTTILALDGGDICHQYGKKFEKSAKVKDGSSKGKELSQGYWLNQISAYNPWSEETFPILLWIYSALEEGFKSANNETFKIVEKLVEQIGDLGLWVIDRGYDAGKVLAFFLGKGLHFIVRMKKNRNIIYKGKSSNIWEVAHGINRRVQMGKYGRFGSANVEIELDQVKYQTTLICYKDKRNKEPMIFLTEGWIRSTKELKRRIRGYFRRWGVEECYRFEKQGFEIEKSRTRNYERIKALLGLTIISWLILIKVNESPRLREVVLKEARMEKEKPKDRPRFIYYRLIRGIQRMFAGVKQLFLFRLKRQEREILTLNTLQQMPLFKNTPLPDEFQYIWLPEAA